MCRFIPHVAVNSHCWRYGPGMKPTVLALIALLAAGCGGSGSSDTSIDTGCFTMSEGVSTFNDAQDAIRAGTATPADTVKAFGKAADKLTEAASFLPSGHLQDLASTAGTALGRARVAADSGGDYNLDRGVAVDALNEAAPLCKGHTP